MAMNGNKCLRHPDLVWKLVNFSKNYLRNIKAILLLRCTNCAARRNFFLENRPSILMIFFIARFRSFAIVMYFLFLAVTLISAEIFLVEKNGACGMYCRVYLDCNTRPCDTRPDISYREQDGTSSCDMIKDTGTCWQFRGVNKPFPTIDLRDWHISARRIWL